MIVVGLTGSIGMGKTTAAAMFREFGAGVFDADHCVHELYSGDAVAAVEKAFPGVSCEGRINRDWLGARVLADSRAMARLEAIVHPMVAERRRAFIGNMRAAAVRIAVLDAPLLFETGAEYDLNAIVVVTAGAAVQRQRVLSREGMDESKFAAIIGRQMPDAEKRRRAHFIVQTSNGFEAARRQIRTIISAMASCESSLKNIGFVG
jgi:dephospho-CoA kinase